MLLLVRADRGRPAVLWWAPLILAAWANLHGGFLAGVAIFTLWTAARLLAALVRARRIDAAIRAEWTIVLAWAASIFATLVTPYGVGLWRFLLRTAIGPRPEIVEWNPIEAFSVLGAAYLVLLAVGIAGLVGSRRPRSPAALAVFGCVALAPLTAVRHTPLVGLALVVLAGEHIGSASSAWMARWPSAGQETRWRLRPWVASIFAIQAAGLIVLSVPHVRCIEVSTTDYPIAAVGILRASEVRGNLAIFFDWGEYAIWHLGPGVRVSMDGRRETLYPDAVYWDDHRFTFGIGDWQAALGRGPADLALVSPRFAALNLMKLEPGWRLVYEDPASGLFVRRGSPLAEQLAVAPRPPRPERACFP
jgi:hypothetical protein